MHLPLQVLHLLTHLFLYSVVEEFICCALSYLHSYQNIFFINSVAYLVQIVLRQIQESQIGSEQIVKSGLLSFWSLSTGWYCKEHRRT